MESSMKENIQETAAHIAEVMHGLESALTFSNLTHVAAALPRLSATLSPMHVLQLSAGGLQSFIDILNAPSAKRDRAGKAAAGLIRFLLSAPAAALEMAKIFIRFGFITGAGAAAVATASTVLCTVVSCVMTISLALNWYEAHKKANDPAYYIQNRLTKCDNLAQRIHALERKLETSTDSAKIQEEIKRYKIIQTRLLNQAFACYRYRASVISTAKEESSQPVSIKSREEDTLGFLKAYGAKSAFLAKKTKDDPVLNSLTDEQQQALDTQQYNKESTKASETSKYLFVGMLGTAGMIMMVAAPVCPPLLFVGIALSCVAGFAGLALFNVSSMKFCT